MLHTLNDGSQIAVFPIWRNVSVQYYDIGYIRRLVIKLDAEGEVISGNILEMIGNKDYLNTYKEDLPPSFYNGTLQNTGVIAWEREIDDWSQINTQGNKTDGPSCVDLYNFNFDTCEVEIWRNCGGTNEVGEPVFVLIDTMDSEGCGSSGGGTPPSGGGYNPPPPPDDGYTPPTGGGGTGDGTASPNNPSNNPSGEPNPNAPQNPTPVFTDLDGNPTRPDPGDNTIDLPFIAPEEAFLPPPLPPVFDLTSFEQAKGFDETLYRAYVSAQNTSLSHLQKAAWYNQPNGHTVGIGWYTIHGISAEAQVVKELIGGLTGVSIQTFVATGNPYAVLYAKENTEIIHAPNPKTDLIMTVNKDESSMIFNLTLVDLPSVGVTNYYQDTEYQGRTDFIIEVKNLSANVGNNLTKFRNLARYVLNGLRQSIRDKPISNRRWRYASLNIR